MGSALRVVAMGHTGTALRAREVSARRSGGSGRTRMGWCTPLAAMLSASSRSLAWSNVLRGFVRLATMLGTAAMNMRGPAPGSGIAAVAWSCWSVAMVMPPAESG